MSKYWTRKGDQEDLDERTATPFAELVGHGNMGFPHPTYHVAAAVVENNGEILCTQRGNSKHSYIAYHWEFPGGKIEEGETSEQALQRELAEELNLQVSIKEPLCAICHTYDDFSVELEAFLCTSASRDIALKEHHDAKWLKREELQRLDWCAADNAIVKELTTKIQG